MEYTNDQPLIETTIYDYIEVNGRISKKLFEKVVIPKLAQLEQLKRENEELKKQIGSLSDELDYIKEYDRNKN